VTPEVAKEMIPILEAIVRGEEVERRCEGENWEPQCGAMILNDSWEFRIKPSLREFWINVYREAGHSHTVHHSKELAVKFADSHVRRTIKVREVLNED